MRHFVKPDQPLQPVCKGSRVWRLQGAKCASSATLSTYQNAKLTVFKWRCDAGLQAIGTFASVKAAVMATGVWCVW